MRPQVTCAAQPGRARARAPRRRAAPRAAPRARATGEQWPGPRVSDDLEGVRSCRGASRAPSAVRALSRRRRGSSGRRLSGPREPQSGYSVTPPRRTGVLVLGSPRGSSLRRSYILGAGRPAPPRIAPARRHGSRRAAHELARAGAPFSDGRRRWIASSPPPAPAFLFSSLQLRCGGVLHLSTASPTASPPPVRGARTPSQRSGLQPTLLDGGFFLREAKIPSHHSAEGRASSAHRTRGSRSHRRRRSLAPRRSASRIRRRGGLYDE